MLEPNHAFPSCWGSTNTMCHVAGVQDGWPAHLLHQFDADHHEQTQAAVVTTSHRQPPPPQHTTTWHEPVSTPTTVWIQGRGSCTCSLRSPEDVLGWRVNHSDVYEHIVMRTLLTDHAPYVFTCRVQRLLCVCSPTCVLLQRVQLFPPRSACLHLCRLWQGRERSVKDKCLPFLLYFYCYIFDLHYLCIQLLLNTIYVYIHIYICDIPNLFNCLLLPFGISEW